MVDSKWHVPDGSDIPPAAGGGAGGSASCSGRQAGTSLREAVKVEKMKNEWKLPFQVKTSVIFLSS